MTDVAIRPNTDGALALHPTDTVRSLVDWASELEAAGRIGKALCSTSFVPASFRGKPDETAAAILTGAAMGLAPTAALQMMYVINGRVGMYARAQVALLRAAGHDIWTEESTDASVTVAGRRRGWPQDRAERITITLAQAKAAGWAKSDGPWRHPQDMLYARAASRVASKLAPELLYGIPAVEDLEDLPPIKAEARVTGAALLAPAPTIRAVTGTETAEDAAAIVAQNLEAMGLTLGGMREPVDIGDAPEAITAPQSRKLHALLGQTGRSDRAEGLRFLTLLLDRDVETTKTLTKDEARIAIDALEAEANQPQLTEVQP